MTEKLITNVTSLHSHALRLLLKRLIAILDPLKSTRRLLTQQVPAGTFGMATSSETPCIDARPRGCSPPLPTWCSLRSHDSLFGPNSIKLITLVVARRSRVMEWRVGCPAVAMWILNTNTYKPDNHLTSHQAKSTVSNELVKCGWP